MAYTVAELSAVPAWPWHGHGWPEGLKLKLSLRLSVTSSVVTVSWFTCYYCARPINATGSKNSKMSEVFKIKVAENHTQPQVTAQEADLSVYYCACTPMAQRQWQCRFQSYAKTAISNEIDKA